MGIFDKLFGKKSKESEVKDIREEGEEEELSQELEEELQKMEDELKSSRELVEQKVELDEELKLKQDSYEALKDIDSIAKVTLMEVMAETVFPELKEEASYEEAPYKYEHKFGISKVMMGELPSCQYLGDLEYLRRNKGKCRKCTWVAVCIARGNNIYF